jgi:hypothetical protein
MLEANSVQAGATASHPEDVERALSTLARTTSLARLPLRSRRGPRERSVERLAASYVDNAFKMFNLPQSKTANAVVLRIVLGLGDEHRVERYLSPPRRTR